MKTKKNIIALLMIALLQIPLLADGFIVIPNPPMFPIHTPFPLEVVYHRVNVSVDGQVATTHIDQSFFNPTNHQLEGYYLFPIPEGAIIKDFTMQINGKETPAELLDADKARKIYEEIVRNALDPALLEYDGRGVFKVRIFPIEPGKEKKVTISYSEILQKDFATTEYIYPLNTEKFSAKPLKDVSIKVDIKSENEVKNVLCPTHNIDVVKKDEKHTVISYEEQNVKPDIDFKLYFDSGESDIGLSLLTYNTTKEDGYFFLSLSPSFFTDQEEVIDKDVTFIVDVSGSMAGEKLEYAKNALNYCIDNLNDDDRFEIIRFSTEARALFKSLVEVNDEHIKEARTFIKDMNPVGGTNIEEAMQLAMESATMDDRPHIIVFITDGKPTIGEIDENALLKSIEKTNKNNMRVFTFGIGEDINTHLLDKISELTRATRTYVSPSEDIEMKITQFFDKVQSPVLTDIAIEYGDDIDTYSIHPNNIPDLFRGSNLTLLGRYKGEGTKDIVLTGKVDEKKVSHTFQVAYSSDNKEYDFIPPLWAARRIGYLLDQMRLHGESKEVIDEIILLARTHGIVTPYTSYLIMEDEAVRVTRNELDDDIQTMGNFTSINSEINTRFHKEFEAMEDKSGSGSIQVSEEFRDLNYAENVVQTRQGESRMGYFDESGNERNIAQQVRNVQGRAVYQSGDWWVDSDLQKNENNDKQRIKFASDEYFELLRNKPESAQFLALGQNVRFNIDDTYYEIYED